MKLRRETIAAVLFFSWSLPTAVGATNYSVDSSGDEVVANGELTLREAVEAASTDAPVGDAPAGSSTGLDSISFAPGISLVQLTLGELALAGELRIRATESDPVTIDAGGTSRVASVAAGAVVTLRDLVLTDGSAVDGGALRIEGGAIAALERLMLSDSVASGSGGGLWNQGEIRVLDVLICQGNEATGDSIDEGGGGIYNNGGTIDLLNGSLQLDGNRASGLAGGGGGLFNHTGGVLKAGLVRASGNTANRGGGGMLENSGLISGLNGLLLSGNSAGVDIGDGAAPNPGNGGGLLLLSGDMSVGLGIQNNFAATSGGGIWLDTGTSLAASGDIVGNVASGNSASQGGGGLFNAGGEFSYVGSFAAFTPAELSSNAADGDEGSGGGLYSTGGAITLRFVSVGVNQASGDGGGMKVTGGTIFLDEQTDIALNIAGTGTAPDRGDGGGLYLDGPVTVTIGEPDESSASIRNNEAARRGGGVWFGPGATLDAFESRLSISQNTALGAGTADGGGGLYNDGATLDLDGVSIGLNEATTRGGGLFQASGSTTLHRHLGSNSASEGGGAFVDGGELRLDRASISANEADRGAGVAVRAGTLSLSQSTLSRNEATNVGGGILATGGSLELLGSTVTENLASEGGGLAIEGGSVTAESTIIAQNSAGSAPDISGPLFSQGFNFFGTSQGATITGDTSSNLSGDARLGDVQFDGRSVFYVPETGSPAVDQGVATDSAVDQRGEPRTLDNTDIPNAADGTDIGSVEVQDAGSGGTGDQAIIEIPTASTWGLMLLGLLLSAAGALVLRRTTA